jgi:hypothetical protein
MTSTPELRAFAGDILISSFVPFAFFAAIPLTCLGRFLFAWIERLQLYSDQLRGKQSK